jgi:hypothetical protein
VPSAESSEEVATEDDEHIEGYELRKEIHVVASSPASTSTSSSSADETQESES